MSRKETDYFSIGRKVASIPCVVGKVVGDVTNAIVSGDLFTPKNQALIARRARVEKLSQSNLPWEEINRELGIKPPRTHKTHNL